MPKSVLLYLSDKAQSFGLEFSLYQLFPNKKTETQLRVKLYVVFYLALAKYRPSYSSKTANL